MKGKKNKTNALLERIAIALEKIAESMDKYALQITSEEVLNLTKKSIPLANEKTQEIISEKDITLIEDFLSSKNIQIKFLAQEDAADDVINSLAHFLGEHYGALSELLSKIKASMQTGGFITLAMKDYTQKNVSDVCQFCTRLHNIAFLEQYNYSKSPQFLIRAKTTTLPTAQNFFSGKWLERFVLQTIQKSVSSISNELGKEVKFSYLINPQIILPNGNDFELDIIFHVNGIFYWIEAKTGDYQQHISKYSKMAKTLNLDYEHSIMVLTDVQPDQSNALTSLFSMTVYGLAQLEQGLIDSIKKDIQSSNK